ncbi:MAG: hypothetical protein MUP30_06315 [Deltaproteobacteria bacterium]|nr:hypothetical protein [Deltaproteobacteria bacterium]
MNDHIRIFKTGKLYELDMASHLLSGKGIPFYRESENSGGLRLAMPFQPVMGPGQWYSILVHKDNAAKAKDELNNLPFEITTNPDIWHFGPSEAVKKFWRMGTWVYLLIGFLLLIMYIYDRIVNMKN